MAMITSAKNSDWPLDIEIQDLNRAGLPSPSIIRMKLFTLDEKLIIRKPPSKVAVNAHLYTCLRCPTSTTRTRIILS